MTKDKVNKLFLFQIMLINWYYVYRFTSSSCARSKIKIIFLFAATFFFFGQKPLFWIIIGLISLYSIHTFDSYLRVLMNRLAQCLKTNRSKIQLFSRREMCLSRRIFFLYILVTYAKIVDLCKIWNIPFLTYLYASWTPESEKKVFLTLSVHLTLLYADNNSQKDNN